MLPQPYFPEPYFPPEYFGSEEASPPAAQAGWRSLFCRWVGGLSAVPTVTSEFPTGPFQITLQAFVPRHVLSHYNPQQVLDAYTGQTVLQGEMG